jgi:hypothetical protein
LTLALAAESIIQPYVILLFLPLLIVLAAHYVFQSKLLPLRRALWLLIPLLLHIALVAYQYLAISNDPVWMDFTEQNKTLSPPVIYYLLGYLPFIVPIVAGARVFRLAKINARWWLPIIWVAIVALLLYAPFQTQRRYLLGLQTPLAVLATYGWSRVILPRIRPSRRWAVTFVYLTLTAIALIGLLAANVTALADPQHRDDLFFQPDEVRAFEWIRQNVNPDDLVLTTFDWSGKGNGGRLVAATGQRVFIGHWIETAYFDEKIQQLHQFYDSSTSDSWRRDYLKQINAKYVWYDDSVYQFGHWNPANADYLEAVFDTDHVSIWKVK